MKALTTLLKDIADAIREKKGTTELINPQDFSTEIRGISGGGNLEGDWAYFEVQGENINTQGAGGMIAAIADSVVATLHASMGNNAGAYLNRFAIGNLYALTMISYTDDYSIIRRCAFNLNRVCSINVGQDEFQYTVREALFPKEGDTHYEMFLEAGIKQMFATVGASLVEIEKDDYFNTDFSYLLKDNN